MIPDHLVFNPHHFNLAANKNAWNSQKTRLITNDPKLHNQQPQFIMAYMANFNDVAGEKPFLFKIGAD